MKTKILLVFCLGCFLFHNPRGYAGEIIVDKIPGANRSKYLVITHSNSDLYWNVPNSFTIKSKDDVIKAILIDSGKVTKMNDTLFYIRPFSKSSAKLTFIGTERYIKTYEVQKLPIPTQLYFRGIPLNKLSSWGYLYTIDELKKSNKIVAESNGFTFKIKQFWLGFSDTPRGPMLPNSQTFQSDSLGLDYVKELKKAPDGLGIMAHDVYLLSPDSTVSLISNMDLGKLVKDSTSLIINRFGGYTKIYSDVRIKIAGKPDQYDIRTIKKIISDLNSCIPTLKVKLVKYLPSITIKLDTVYKETRKGSITHTNIRYSYGENKFFPLLSNTDIFINTKVITNYNVRDSILLHAILSSLFQSPRIEKNYAGSAIIGNQNRLTTEDKIALKTIFTNGIDKKIVMFFPDFKNLPSLNFIALLIICILVYLILNEISNHIDFSRLIRSELRESELIRRTVYSINLALIVIFIMWIIKFDAEHNDPHFRHPYFVSYYLYFTSYAVLAGLLFLWSERITDRLALRWQKSRMIVNSIMTTISLYIAYQIIYLFVRGEILRFQTIDQHALIIASSIIIVRFYHEYEKTKISKLLREKEFEIMKQKELKYRAELNALHARINPHFLYNALNSLASLARIDAERTEKMALSLSRLFRFTLNREEDMISTIDQEIEIAKLYLEIEKHRYEERLEYTITVDEKVKERSVPRLLIQPLVENSIKHGISKITGQGIVKIKVFEKDKELFIEIYDNGPGFPDGLLSGYGLQNTYDKLTLIYKKQYEVKFINSSEKYLQIILKK